MVNRPTVLDGPPVTGHHRVWPIPFDYHRAVVDPLVAHDLEVSRLEAPEQKLAQALDMMESGLRLKRAAIQHLRKGATSEQVEEALVRWLCAGG